MAARSPAQSTTQAGLPSARLRKPAADLTAPTTTPATAAAARTRPAASETVRAKTAPKTGLEATKTTAKTATSKAAHQSNAEETACARPPLAPYATLSRAAETEARAVPADAASPEISAVRRTGLPARWSGLQETAAFAPVPAQTAQADFQATSRPGTGKTATPQTACL